MRRLIFLIAIALAIPTAGVTDTREDVAGANCNLMLVMHSLKRDGLLRADVASFLDGFEYAMSVMIQASRAKPFSTYNEICGESSSSTVQEVFKQVIERSKTTADN